MKQLWRLRRVSCGGWSVPLVRRCICLLLLGVIPLPVAAEDSLADRIQPLIDRHQGEVTVAVKHLSSQESFQHLGDQPMPTASLIKFPLMIAAYQAAEKGELDLQKKLTLSEEDKVPGSGILTSHFSEGATISVRDAIELMMVYSDNTATNMVIDQVGLKATANLMEQLGCPNTKLHSKVFRRDTSVFPDRSSQFGLGSTTAAEMIRLLQRLHDRQMVSRPASGRMIQHMFRCDSTNKIPRFLPPGVKVAHKSGAISSVRCDAGIVVQGEQAFAICVLTRKNKDQSWGDNNAAEILCGKIAKAAYDHFFPNRPADPRQRRDLKIGAGGQLVEALQRTLNARMDPSPGLAVDGDFGPNTQAAVIEFQQRHKLEASGEVDRATWDALGTLLFEEEAVPDPAEINSAVVEKRPPDKLEGSPYVTCKSWAIGDAESGKVLWSDRADRPLPMASTTKIMTAVVVLRLAEKDSSLLDEIVTFSSRADETIGSSCRIRAGEQVSVGELLYGLLLPSGNDASVALAEHIGGRLGGEDDVGDDSASDAYDRFVDKMNRTADDLGLTSTRFKNTHGMSVPGHHSSARDLVRLAWHSMQVPAFRKYVGTSQRGCTVTGPGGYRRNLVWRNTNRLLAITGYDGVKTGTTTAAGACLVSRGRQGEESLIVVVLGSSSSDARYADTRNLYRWAFNQLRD